MIEPTPTPTSQIAGNGRDPDNQVDPRTITGAWHVVHGRYGKRQHDRPVWWVLLYHFAKAVVGIAPYVIAAIALKKCGIPLPGTGP